MRQDEAGWAKGPRHTGAASHANAQHQPHAIAAFPAEHTLGPFDDLVSDHRFQTRDLRTQSHRFLTLTWVPIAQEDVVQPGGNDDILIHQVSD